ncbi:MAG: CesT family type III secretion system chaperone [Ramlibacter sp.]
MSLDLQDVCASFCALAKVPAPSLQAQNDGTVAFNVQYRGVTVDLAAQPGIDATHAYVLFHMGELDPAHADCGRILLALLHTNFVNLRANQPVLSCRPSTHMATLQWAFPLAETTGENLLQLIEQGVDLVLQWRQTHFLAPDAAQPGAVLSDAIASYA